MVRAVGAFVLCALGLSAPGMAQGIVGLSPEAPASYAMREFGINLSTTDVTIQNDDLSVGSGEFPTNLTLTRTYSAIGYPFRNLNNIAGQNHYTGFGQGSTHNLLAYFTRQRCTNLSNINGRFISLTAVVFGRTYRFSGGGCLSSGSLNITSNLDDGATLEIINPSQSISTYLLTTPEGVRVTFTDDAGFRYDTIGGRYARVAEFPNGDFVGFTYAASPTVSGTVRPITVTNSRGYGIRFGYTNRARYPNQLTDSSLIVSATSFRQTSSNAIDLNTVIYSYDSTQYVVASFQNATGGLFRYAYNEGRPTAIFYPRNSTTTPSISISYFDGLSQVNGGDTVVGPLGAVLFYGPNGQSFTASGIISGFQDNVYDAQWSVPLSVTDALGNSTRLEFSDPTAPDPISVNVIAPDGASRGYATVFCPTSPACTLPSHFVRMPTNSRDENGNFWTYGYDYHGRPSSATDPEGGRRALVRDARGNVVEVRNTPKTGGGLADIVSSAGYVACSQANYRFCNQPSYTIDPRGGRWDFQYDPVSGGVAVSLAPADASGYRAVTRYNYTMFSYGPVARPSFVLANGITLLTAKDTCLSSTVPAGVVDFSFVCPTADRVRETYLYTPSTASQSSSLEIVGIRPDADNSAAISAMTYDNVGNLTSTQDLNGNISYRTYDALRRVVFEISADPDGGGPLPRQMVKHVYDANGNEVRTETGTGQQVNCSDFVMNRFVRRTFDLNDNLTRTEEVSP